MGGLLDTRLSSSDDQSTSNSTTNTTVQTYQPQDASVGDVSNKLTLAGSSGNTVNLLDAGTVAASRDLALSGLQGAFKSSERSIETAQFAIAQALELAKGSSAASGVEVAKVGGWTLGALGLGAAFIGWLVLSPSHSRKG